MVACWVTAPGSAGRQWERLHSSAPQPRPGGVVNMECGLAGPAPPSWGVTCLPLPHKSLLLQQQMHQGSTWEDNGQGTTAEKVKPRCEAMLSTDIKDG